MTIVCLANREGPDWFMMVRVTDVIEHAGRRYHLTKRVTHGGWPVYEEVRQP